MAPPLADPMALTTAQLTGGASTRSDQPMLRLIRPSRAAFSEEGLYMELLAAEHSGEEPNDGELEGSGDDFTGLLSGSGNNPYYTLIMGTLINPYLVAKALKSARTLINPFFCNTDLRALLTDQQTQAQTTFGVGQASHRVPVAYGWNQMVHSSAAFPILMWYWPGLDPLMHYPAVGTDHVEEEKVVVWLRVQSQAGPMRAKTIVRPGLNRNP
ncbi:hypothetical protein DFH06DRAFT_1149187 [Mycena polygramma]|nr:hypothetical protein DFH06DRAFT_1149187 [Mycena polygramma]